LGLKVTGDKNMSISREMDRVFELLQHLSEGKPIDDIKNELIILVRQAGAGAKGEHGAVYERMKMDIDLNPDRKDKLVKFMSGPTPLVRSWTASFIEQLLEEHIAIPLLEDALQKETDTESASWMAMNLARKSRRNNDPKISKIIGQLYEKKKGDPLAIQIARAWGYAGSKQATPVLIEFLRIGGYDQILTALDGLLGIIHLGLCSDEDLEAVWSVFFTTKWSDVRKRCADTLLYSGGKLKTGVIKRFLGIIASPGDDEIRNDAADALIVIGEIPDNITEQCLADIIKALTISDPSMVAKEVKIIDIFYKDWENKFVDLMLTSKDEGLRSALARALSVETKSRQKAVGLLKTYIHDDNPEVKQRITDALKEMGGQEAFESLQALLQTRYIQPSEQLQATSQQVFDTTVSRMKKNYDTNVLMNQIIFFLGILVVISGIVVEIAFPAENRFFGTAGIIAGLGTLVSLFFFGPLKKIQQAITELIQVEVAFMSFMHRILQARSIFEQMYISKKIDINALSKFDTLINDGMVQTIQLLEQSKNDSKAKN
jgi:hypothetical protein